ncbi:hypothetical protein DFH08DRAFT_1079838 [Mycena albidolilacea]|uniref:Uncharacterized protein n=1 Tax=Mycena albidolilacea TaxID=1033008 RepID=A0AAD7A2L6_9AGAR|nr:hypothetical protein DFH08DRAFT_1079838 [Mycena albidolilacea]
MDVPTSDFAFPLPPTITLESNSILMGGGKVTSSSSGDPGKETPTTASLSVMGDPTTLPAKTEAGSTLRAKTEATSTSAAASESTAVNTPIYTLTLPPGMTTVTRFTPSSTAGSAQASGLSSIAPIDMCHMSPATPTRVIVGVSVAISGIILVVGLVFFVLRARRRRRNDTGTISQFVRAGSAETLGGAREGSSERQDADPDPLDGLGGAHLASEADREIATLRIRVARLEAGIQEARALDAPPEYIAA